MVGSSRGDDPPPLLKPMPHFTTYGGTSFSSLRQEDTIRHIDSREIKGGASTLFGESIFKPQSIAETSSVSIDDNDFKPGASDDDIIGLDVGPVNKLADRGWWTVDGANFREPQQDSLTNAGKEGFTWEAASDIWTNGGASTFAEIEIDPMVLLDNGIGSEHWPEPAGELFVLGSAVASLGSGSDPMLGSLGGEGVWIQNNGIGSMASTIVVDNHI